MIDSLRRQELSCMKLMCLKGRTLHSQWSTVLTDVWNDFMHHPLRPWLSVLHVCLETSKQLLHNLLKKYFSNEYVCSRLKVGAIACSPVTSRWELFFEAIAWDGWKGSFDSCVFPRSPQRRPSLRLLEKNVSFSCLCFPVSAAFL